MFRVFGERDDLGLLKSSLWNQSKKKAFKSKEICSSIDKAYNWHNHESGTEIRAIEIWAIPEVASLINIALIFDIVYTLGYNLDEVFTKYFNTMASGDYKYVLNCSIMFITFLENLIDTRSKEFNYQRRNTYSLVPPTMTQGIPGDSSVMCITFLQSYK